MSTDRGPAIVALALCAACHTHLEPSDAGLSTSPSATPSVSATAIATATGATSATATAPAPTPTCHADTDCVSATCCGPFGANEACVPRATVRCAGIACPQMLSSFACGCRAGKCITTRARKKDVDLGTLGQP